MNKLIKIIALSTSLINFVLANESVNVYVWSGEIPTQVIQQFERETGIKVNYSTYDSNETLYTKLKAVKKPNYDVIMPSNYYVQRLQQANLISPLNPKYLPNLKNIDPFFREREISHFPYSIPFVWGTTGIFVNQRYHHAHLIRDWRDLWQNKYRNQLLLLDDPREIFSLALLTLGYDPNDSNPLHIEAAFELLKKLVPNIKVFNSTAIDSLMIDEDITIGVAWNGGVYNAARENPKLQFIYPREGFVIWSDNLAIVNHAPHLVNAYRFINYLLRPEVSQQTTLTFGYGITNQAGQRLLPEFIQKNRNLFPPKSVLRYGKFISHLSPETTLLYTQYWHKLKLGPFEPSNSVKP